MKLPFIYSNGSPESWFDFNVLSVVAQARTTTSSDFVQPFPGGATHSGGNASVIFGSTAGVKHTQLTKPFIISEGYNLYDIAPELRKCNNPNNDIEEFFKKVGPIYTGTFNFQNHLLNAGYDIVYIDNAKGTDDIVRNAQLFEAVVRWVNQNKVGGTASGERNVVMGQSMGGLVSRYGLAEMTKRGNDDPHTRLLLLHDSPQRGAYNPVGVQSLGRSFDVPFLFGNSLADLNGQVRATVRVLNQPATQQLSILNAFNGRSDIRPNTFIPNTYQPMITFSGPMPYDVIAVSNGSQCGSGQNTPVGVTISNSSLALLLPIPYVGPTGVTGEIASYGLPVYGQQATVSRVDIRLEYRIRIGICPFCVTIPIRLRLLRESAQSPPNTLPYETLPGGTTNPYQQAGSCADGFDFGSLNGIYAAYFRTSLYNGDLCFVPTYSAMDVPIVSPSTAAAKYINNITDSPSPPNVKRYLAQEAVNSGSGFNTAHISFTPRNSEWIFNEMQRPVGNTTPNPIACQTVPECDPSQQAAINGPDFICPTSTGQFFISNLPAGYTVTWQATAGVSPATGTGLIYSVRMPSGSAVNSQITATISNGCYSRTATRQVNVSRLKLSQYAVAGCGIGVVATVIGADNVIWVVNGQEQTGLLVADGSREFFEYVSGRVTVALRGVNHCTGASFTSNTSTKTRPKTGPQCLERHAPGTTIPATLYPNPARETITVHLENASPNAGATTALTHTVRLFDAHGQLRAEQTSTGAETVRLKTDQLPAGLYFVHILRGTQVLSRQQVQIEP